MPVKKKQKTGKDQAIKVENATTDADTTTLASQVTINAQYFAKVNECFNTILAEFPGADIQDPLPESGDTGFRGLKGNGAPFTSSVYNEKIIAKEEYNAHINFLWQSRTGSVMPYLPLYWDRVVEYADAHLPTPRLPKGSALVLLADFDVPPGQSVPKGHICRVSPCETAHAVAYRVATRIKEKAPSAELQEWLRWLLSYPAIFIKLQTDDERYAEANSLREDASGTARAVVLTARQLVHNIAGFKAIKEKSTKTKIGADMLAKFWAEHVRVSKNNEHMTNKSTIDVCLTIKERVFTIAGAEDIIMDGECLSGPQSFWNQIFKTQEIIYRCQTKTKIFWVMCCVKDNLRSGKYNDADITINMLKTGSKSLSDAWIMQLQMKDHLLGKWLDDKDFPGYMKSKAREVFASHESWRLMWHPMGDADVALDSTWLFSWPRFGKELLDFLESAIYLPTPLEEHSYRLAIKNQSTVEELLLQRPWVDVIANLHASHKTTAELGAQAPSQTPNNTAEGGDPENAVNTPTVIEDESGPSLPQQLAAAVQRLAKQQTSYIVESSSFTSMKQLIEATPLAMVRASQESGNVLILCDCNTWGSTDHRPDIRVTPIGKEKLDVPVRAIIASRHGVEDPGQLNFGDFYVMINGGKDRKRQWLKPLKNENIAQHKGKDKNRLVCRTTMVHCSEQSWRNRKKVSRGQAKLTQAMYTVSSASTFSNLRHASFLTITGSTRSDVCGPIDLDPISDLPTLPIEKFKEFFGKRYILAGGKLPDDSDNDDDDDDDDPDGESEPPSDPPIAPHGLPLSLMTNYIAAHNIKHVIDMSPTMNLGFEVVRTGGSYVAICASQMQADWLKKSLIDKLMVAIVDKTEKLLYDARFAPEIAEEGSLTIYIYIYIYIYIGNSGTCHVTQHATEHAEMIDFGSTRTHVQQHAETHTHTLCVETCIHHWG